MARSRRFSTAYRPMPRRMGGPRRRRPRPGLCRVRGRVARAPSHRLPRLIVVRTASKAYALAGLRVGFAIGRPDVIAALNPYRPPGSVSTVSATVVTEALLDPAVLDANLSRVAAERDDSPMACVGPAGPSVRRSRTSCWSISRRPSARPRSPRAASSAVSAPHVRTRATSPPISGSWSGLPTRTIASSVTPKLSTPGDQHDHLLGDLIIGRAMAVA